MVPAVALEPQVMVCPVMVLLHESRTTPEYCCVACDFTFAAEGLITICEGAPRFTTTVAEPVVPLAARAVMAAVYVPGVQVAVRMPLLVMVPAGGDAVQVKVSFDTMLPMLSRACAEKPTTPPAATVAV